MYNIKYHWLHLRTPELHLTSVRFELLLPVARRDILQVTSEVYNLEELGEVKQLAQHLLASKTPINILVNNAGEAKLYSARNAYAMS